ncbi:MAG: DNA-binding protein [Nitrospirae bacterium CG08_land_8_20_14_0_20_52_24]|nr:MAG: DNA-binding protein [Nitrospirae bacterium CG08_land_8_20_14_0_20_52_24]PIV84940.1 MAG: DNA-binding protein [Nitrospirae bacterium CG17_big_fil_post_rev_8_21_14_2_50_50_9]PIX85306.1 MAG: DNA-binding protein [Nitrospirae bacterium CG_4_10_14_3_um_filter_53_41]
MDETVQYWIELSEYDLMVANSMLEKGHYLYVGFMCHQSVEKMLKALYVYKNKSVPPYIHKLDKLIGLTELKKVFSEDAYDLMDELTPLNIQARYPAYKEAIHKLIGKEKANDILARTKELVLWLKAQIR